MMSVKIISALVLGWISCEFIPQKKKPNFSKIIDNISEVIFLSKFEKSKCQEKNITNFSEVNYPSNLESLDSQFVHITDLSNVNCPSCLKKLNTSNSMDDTFSYDIEPID